MRYFINFNLHQAYYQVNYLKAHIKIHIYKYENTNFNELDKFIKHIKHKSQHQKIYYKYITHNEYKNYQFLSLTETSNEKEIGSETS